MAEKIKSRSLKINILTAKSSWMNLYDEKLNKALDENGHKVGYVSSKADLEKADISFFLSCFEIIGPEYLKKSDHNIVVHASDLPHGKGWSPTSWQILEGKNEIPLTLFEAVDAVDAGRIYLKDLIRLSGSELIDEWQCLLGNKIVDMCLAFVKGYPENIKNGYEQNGEESFYSRRLPKDSELDPNKTIAEQFNLLRIVDNEKYPAFFVKNGKKYLLKIYEDQNEN